MSSQSHNNYPTQDQGFYEEQDRKRIEAQERLGEVYLSDLAAHPEADWVMIGDKTAVIYGRGTDEKMPTGEAWEALEDSTGEQVHLFGRD